MYPLNSKALTASIGALFLTAAISGCAEYHAYENCGSDSCSGDANITANVQSSFAQHGELQGPDQLYVNTVDHVVYLSGTVETGLHRITAESLARETPGVTRVVDNIGVEK
ncbi:MAG: BON domain-containing protein [Steroidobacteraceae bacterium]